MDQDNNYEIIEIITNLNSALHKKSEPPRQYETITGVCTREELADLTKYNWYRGDITEEEITNLSGCRDCFFVRHTPDNDMIFSKDVKGRKSHNMILRSPEGFYLEGKREKLESIPIMIYHYQQLGKSVNQQVLGMDLASFQAYMHNNVS